MLRELLESRVKSRVENKEKETRGWVQEIQQPNNKSSRKREQRPWRGEKFSQLKDMIFEIKGT